MRLRFLKWLGVLGWEVGVVIVGFGMGWKDWVELRIGNDV